MSKYKGYRNTAICALISTKKAKNRTSFRDTQKHLHCQMFKMEKAPFPFAHVQTWGHAMRLCTLYVHSMCIVRGQNILKSYVKRDIQTHVWLLLVEGKELN